MCLAALLVTLKGLTVQVALTLYTTKWPGKDTEINTVDFET